MFALVYETSGYEIWTPVSMASYWLKVVSRPPRLLEDRSWLVPHSCFYSIERGLFLVSLGNSSQQPTTLGFPWYSSQ